MSEPQEENTIDDLLADEPGTVEVDPSYFAETPNADTPKSSMISCELDNSLDVDLDLGGLETELSLDRSKPLEVLHNPVTSAVIDTSDVASVVRAAIELKSLLAVLDTYEREIKKAARLLASGETKTRRLTAEIDGELQTIQVLLPDDEWPERDLGILATWCNRKEAPDALKAFYRRFVREKIETKRSPIKKEVKKLAAETFPEGSVLAEAKDKLLRINRGSAHRLPRLVIEGDKLSGYDAKRFGDGEDEE